MSLENPCSFLLAKEKTWKSIFNSNIVLSQNLTEKQIMPSKTTVNFLFNDILCYFFIACFDLKIDVFQQAVVKIYHILKPGILDTLVSHKEIIEQTLLEVSALTEEIATETGVQRYSVKKGVLKNCAKFTGKHLCQSLCFNKVAGLTKRSHIQSLGVALLEAITVLGVFVTSVCLRFDCCLLDFWNIICTSQIKENFLNGGLKLNCLWKYFITDRC